MNYEELKKYATIVYSIAGNKINPHEPVSNEIVNEYYARSAFFYKKFHSPEGAMHLPVSFSENTSHREKLQYQAETIDKIINQYHYSNILELGCGMGFNTHYLAKKNPEKKFTGVDLTGDNIILAGKKSKGLENVHFHQGDFDDPESIQGEYDLIFAVETLCHSQNLTDLILNFSGKLSENGRMIIFDAYVKEEAKELTDEYEKQAYQLLLWGFALNHFQKLSDILNADTLSHLNIGNITEYTENIANNVITFQKGAKKALRFPMLLKLLLKAGVIPMVFIKQLSAALFGTYFGYKNYLGYYKLEITKKK